MATDKKVAEQYSGVYARWHKWKKVMLFYGRYNYQGKTYRTEGYLTKTEAKDALTRLRRELLSNPRVTKRPTFGEFVDHFLKVASLETPQTLYEYQKRLRHVRPFFEKFKLDEIRALHVKQYRQHRLSEKPTPKPATINHELATLSKIFTVALEDEKIITHPMARRKLKLFEEKRPPRPLLEDERIRLLAACDLDPKFRGFPAVIITAINTGMRLSELLHLKWDAVDLESRIITVVKSKSKKPRYIPMNRLVHEALRSLERPDEYVFRIDHTGDVKAKFEHKWADLRQLVGLPAVQFKNLRATFATRLTDRKVSVRVVQALLGHSTPVVTERHIRVDKSLEDAVSTLEVGQNLGQNSDDNLDEDP